MASGQNGRAVAVTFTELSWVEIEELKKQVYSKVVLYLLCKEINIKKATVPSFELYLN